MKHKIAINGLVSMFQVFLSGSMLFFIYRFLIKHIGMEEFGLWSIIMTTTSFAKLSEIGMSGRVTKFVSMHIANKKEDQACDVIQTSVLTIAVMMGSVILIAYPISDEILKIAIPLNGMTRAKELLPYAMVSLWLGSLAGAVQAGLDGCQHIVSKNIILMITNIIFMISLLLLVPTYGILGVAIGQIIQTLLVLLISWVVLRKYLLGLPIIVNRWSLLIFKQIFKYSFNFQINSIASLLFEPISKIFMSKYGGLSSVGYYEIASQYILKLRSLLISANQVIVPATAELNEKSPELVRNLYLKSFRFVAYLSTIYYVGIIICSPIVSIFWLDGVNSQFLIFVSILTFGWWINNLSAPAYFINLGTGQMNGNTVLHILGGILNLLLCMFLGPLYGGTGIVLAAMIALLIASISLLLITHYEYKIKIEEALTDINIRLIIEVISAIIIFLYILNFRDFFKIKFLYQNLILIIIYIFISLIFFTRSKYTSKNFKIWKYKKF